MHEGDERALFAVLEGRIEVVKLVDGIERVLGERLPGAIFGEVPITLGTPFPSGFRAAEPSRVMRIEAQRLLRGRRVRRPSVAMKVGALARERIGGLQGVAAEPPQPRALVRRAPLGRAPARSCAASSTATRSRSSWLTPDAADAAERWGGDLPPERRLPAVRVRDGTTLVRPRLREVAELLGLQTQRVRRPSTTRSSSAPGRPASPPPCTGRPRACARS